MPTAGVGALLVGAVVVALACTLAFASCNGADALNNGGGNESGTEQSTGGGGTVGSGANGGSGVGGSGIISSGVADYSPIPLISANQERLLGQFYTKVKVNNGAPGSVVDLLGFEAVVHATSNSFSRTPSININLLTWADVVELCKKKYGTTEDANEANGTISVLEPYTINNNYLTLTFTKTDVYVHASDPSKLYTKSTSTAKFTGNAEGWSLDSFIWAETPIVATFKYANDNYAQAAGLTWAQVVDLVHRYNQNSEILYSNEATGVVKLKFVGGKLEQEITFF